MVVVVVGGVGLLLLFFLTSLSPLLLLGPRLVGGFGCTVPHLPPPTRFSRSRVLLHGPSDVSTGSPPARGRFTRLVPPCPLHFAPQPLGLSVYPFSIRLSREGSRLVTSGSRDGSLTDRGLLPPRSRWALGPGRVSSCPSICGRARRSCAAGGRRASAPRAGRHTRAHTLWLSGCDAEEIVGTGREEGPRTLV